MARVPQGAGCAREDRLHAGGVEPQWRCAHHAGRRGASLSGQRSRAARRRTAEAAAPLTAQAREMSEVAEFEADASTEASGATPAGENSATPAGENSATPAAENSATPAEERAVAPRLKITEIFYSLQGEADTVGFPTVFVRLTGCPLRCQFCDTAYAFHGGEWFTLDAVLGKVRDLAGSDATAPRYVCVT